MKKYYTLAITFVFLFGIGYLFLFDSKINSSLYNAFICTAAVHLGTLIKKYYQGRYQEN
ncbi:hypothetical protein [Tenacibaculum litopenaei]|jgi:hypothetical protein|uniref:hypothetical protein n=1 Tax=Tenacibaculum litopenaei TaxID=396016 RepID=UPI0038B6068E